MAQMIATRLGGLLQIDLLANATFHSLCIDVCYGHGILHREANRFEDGEFFQGGSTRDSTRDEFAQFAGYMTIFNLPILNCQQNVAGFGQGGCVVVYEDAAALDGRSILFWHGMRVGAYGLEVCSRLHPVAVDWRRL